MLIVTSKGSCLCLQVLLKVIFDGFNFLNADSSLKAAISIYIALKFVPVKTIGFGLYNYSNTLSIEKNLCSMAHYLFLIKHD
jgi:hypothetical protein